MPILCGNFNMRLLKSIAAKDYSLEQISVWAPDSYDENA